MTQNRPDLARGVPAPEEQDVAETTGDLFGDADVTRTIADDPLLKFVIRWWRELVVALAVVAVAMYFSYRFRETYVRSMRTAADTYSKVRAEYANYISLMERLAVETKEAGAKKEKAPEAVIKEKEGEEKGPSDAKAEKPAVDQIAKTKTDLEESRHRLSDYVRALADAKEPYSKVALIYRALIARAEGDSSTEQLREILGNLVAQDEAGFQRADLYNELATILLARSLLDREDSYAEGRRLLALLAKHGKALNLSAASTLVRVSKSPEEQSEAKAIMDELTARQPEYRGLIEEDMGRLVG